jgi:TonB-linked SusC/RagA family outer membrane protein
MYNFYLKKGIRLPIHRRMRKLLLIMKITTLILITVILHVSATSLAQKVTLKEKNVPLVDVFNQISTQTGYDFAFTTEALKAAKPVTINVKNVELKDVLNQIFEGQNLDFSFDNKIVVIKPKEESFIDRAKAALAAIDVTGRVVGEDGQPLPGATVLVRGSNNSTSTDASGYFSLKNVDANATLQITFVGFDKLEIKAKSDLGTIKLTTSQSKLDEVKVIAYGQTTERLSTGNVSSVSAKTIGSQPVNNPLLALEGQVPGLFITQTNGLPGGGVTVRIQGQNSIQKGNDPLIVIDGVPFSSQTIQTVGLNYTSPLGSSGGYRSGLGNPLAFVNPSDIESISVLKDADATAIYGSRAANGVILITTKKGKAGDTKVDIDANQGWGRIAKQFDLLNTQQYLMMRHQALKNNGLPNNPSIATDPTNTDYDINGLWDTTRYTNWQKVLLGNTSHYTNINGSVSGGTNQIQYLVGGTYHRETSVFPGNFADTKGSLHFSLNTSSLNNRFKMQFSGSYLADNNELPQTDLTAAALQLPPDAPAIYKADGTLNWATSPTGVSTWSNPFAGLLATYTSNTSNLMGNALLSYKIIDGLELKSNFGYTNLQINEKSLVPLISYNPENQKSLGSNGRFDTQGNNNVYTWIAEPQLTYQRSFKWGRVNALVGSAIQQTNGSGSSLQAKGFNSDAVISNLASAASISSLGTTASTYKYNALFGRLNYNWGDRFIIDLNARRDGSSRFGSQSQFHDFWSTAGAWIFSEEKLIKENLSWLSFGKIKLSYGTTGNDQIGDYQFLSLYNVYSAGVAYQGVPGIQPAGISNPYLQWEETHKFSSGIDLGFFHDKVIFSFNYSHNLSSNQLNSYPLPSIAGFEGITINLPAKIENNSLDFQLNAKVITTKDFSWSISGNLTIPTTKLVSYPNLANSTFIVGQPVTAYKVFHFLGVDPTTGLYLVADKNGAPTTTPDYSADLTQVINLTPKYYGGLSNSFVYKKLELNLFFQFVKRMGPNYRFGQVTPGLAFTNEPVSVLSAWQKPGDVTSTQQYDSNYSFIGTLGNALNSDAAFSDASYIRLKNLSISYQLPDRWARNMSLRNLSIYLQGENLLTFTKLPGGLDPETLSPAVLPLLRIITTGVRIGL